MALTLTKIGTEIATEKLVVQAVTDNPGNVTTVICEVLINSTVVQATLEHLPVIGSTTDFDFEINSIVKDYFSNEFLALTGPNQTTTLVAMVSVRLHEVLSGVVDPTTYREEAFVKNITQDVFEIEDFDLTNYDCGDAGNTASKLLTSAPSPLPIGDLTSVHVSCLTTSYTGTTPKQEWTIETYLNGVFVTQTTVAVDVPTNGIGGEIVGGNTTYQTTGLTLIALTVTMRYVFTCETLQTLLHNEAKRKCLSLTIHAIRILPFLGIMSSEYKTALPY